MEWKEGSVALGETSRPRHRADNGKRALHGPADPLAAHCVTPSKAGSLDTGVISLTIWKPGSPQYSSGKDTIRITQQDV